MRKKSHISLARDIVRNSEDEGLRKHKWAFYLGNLPFCIKSMKLTELLNR